MLVIVQWHPGNGVGMGKDYTLFAKQPGIVVYQASKYIRKVGLQQLHTWVLDHVQTYALQDCPPTHQPRALQVVLAWM